MINLDKLAKLAAIAIPVIKAWRSRGIVWLKVALMGLLAGATSVLCWTVRVRVESAATKPVIVDGTVASQDHTPSTIITLAVVAVVFVVVDVILHDRNEERKLRRLQLAQHRGWDAKTRAQLLNAALD